MSTQKASVIAESAQPGALTEIASVPIGEPSPNQILINSVALAINPTDWKHILYQIGKPGDILGSDVSGVVAKVGSNVKDFKEGDIVSTFVHGGFYTDRGAFAEYVLADPQATIKYDPATFQKDKVLATGKTHSYGPIDTFEGAASTTLSIVTTVLSYAGNLNISPEDKGKYILIWGGATATGVFAIQLAKLAYGLKVITTASPKNFDYLKELGADRVLNYRDPDVVDQIKAVAKGEIKYALDTVSSDESFQQLYSATYDSADVKIDSLLSKGPNDITLDDRKGNVQFVDPTFTYLVDGITPLHIFGGVFDIKAETRKRYDDFWFNELPKYLPDLKNTNLKVLPQGLESVEPALALSVQNKVSAEKLVFRI